MLTVENTKRERERRRKAETRTTKTEELSSGSLTCETSKKLNVFHCLASQHKQRMVYENQSLLKLEPFAYNPRHKAAMIYRGDGVGCRGAPRFPSPALAWSSAAAPPGSPALTSPLHHVLLGYLASPATYVVRCI